MEWGSVIGIVLALSAILVGQILEGGHLGSLVQGSAFFIVFFGTVGAVILQTGSATLLRGLKMARWVVMPPQYDTQIVDELIRWAKVARQEGFLSLDRFTEENPTSFVQKALRVFVDTPDAEKAKEILELDIYMAERRMKQAAKVWDAAGGYAPTIGILGAVLGLIHVMENLTDPTKLGAGIAVAFVATIYGVGLANLVFLPIANSLKKTISVEILHMEAVVDGMMGIVNGENPRALEQRLRSYYQD